MVLTLWPGDRRRLHHITSLFDFGIVAPLTYNLNQFLLPALVISVVVQAGREAALSFLHFV